MVNRKILYPFISPFILLVILALIVKNFYHNNSYSNKQSLLLRNEPSDKQTHIVKFYDEKIFLDGVNRVKSNFTRTDYSFRGGIVPHHLFPSFMIADFFNRLSVQKPKTVIIIGPNHKEIGDFKALSSLYGWETTFGRVEPNKQIIQSLTYDNVIKIDEDVLPNDPDLGHLD